MFVLAYGVKGGEILLVIDRMFLYLFQLMGVTFPFKAFFNCKFWCFYVCFIDRICGHYSFTYSFSNQQEEGVHFFRKNKFTICSGTHNL